MQKLLISLSVLLLAACSSPVDQSQNQPDNINENQKTIITSTYPLEYLLNELAPENFTVINVLPQGANHHTFSPAASDIAKLETSDLFIYQSADLQPWAEDVHGKNSIEVNQNLTLLSAEHDEDEHEDHNEHEEEHEETT